MDKKFVSAIILAAGGGSRMGGNITKQQICVLGKSVLRRSVEAFQHCELVSEIIVVAKQDEMDFAILETRDLSKVVHIVFGGKTRAESAANGFNAVSNKCAYVAIHDAARCLVSIDDIKMVITDAMKYGAATASYKATDTIKKVDEGGFVCETLEREKTVHVLTPQVFSFDIYRDALSKACALDSSITDDNMLVEKIGVRPYCTQTRRDNVKITYPDDIAYAEFILKGKAND